MPDLSDLRARLEEAKGADRELDALIGATLRIPPDKAPDWCVKWGGRYVGKAGRVYLEHTDGSTGLNWTAAPYTSSTDAALSLIERVLPGRSIIMGARQTPETRPWARVGSPSNGADATAPTLPLALLKALLSALDAEVKHV